jgi:hypothetical protein
MPSNLNMEGAFNPTFRLVQSIVALHYLKLIREQAHLANEYDTPECILLDDIPDYFYEIIEANAQVNRLNDSDWKWFLVSKNLKVGYNTLKHLIVCSCGCPIRFGLTCRHFFKVWQSDLGVEFMLSMINHRWFTSTCIPSSTIVHNMDYGNDDSSGESIPQDVIFFNVIEYSEKIEASVVKYGELDQEQFLQFLRFLDALSPSN